MANQNTDLSSQASPVVTKQPRARARVVCTRCHERKVRCDLDNKPNETACRNCQRERCPCQIYSGTRKRRSRVSSVPTTVRATDIADGKQQHVVRPTEQLLPGSPLPPTRSGYFGAQSVLSISDTTPQSSHGPTMPPYNAEAILTITNATLLPSRTYRTALQEIYMQHLYPVVPVIDQDEPSLLLQQATCFAGSIMRRSNDHPKNFGPNEIYARIKVLLFLGVGNDVLSMLKAYCVLACWTPLSPHIATLDHPWHWAGIALRLAVQLGFHKESTHLQSSKSTESRNIWWYLYCNDTLQATCFGRPPMIRSEDFDVALPSTYSVAGNLVNGSVFVQLIMNMGAIARLASSQQEIYIDELNGPLYTLQEWIANLPPDLSLVKQDGDQMPHDRWAAELHIYYFVSIILTYHLPGLHREDPSLHIAAILASSCVARLYEAMLYRDEINFLNPIHAWLTFAAIIPQFYSLARSSPTSEEEIELLQSTLIQLSMKHNSAKLCLCKINDLRKVPPTKTNLEAHGTRSHDTMATLDSTSEASLLKSVQDLFPFPESISPRMTDLKSQLIVFSRLNPGTSLQHSFPGDEMTFEWADLNFDSIAFLSNDFPADSNLPFFSQ